MRDDFSNDLGNYTQAFFQSRNPGLGLHGDAQSGDFGIENAAGRDPDACIRPVYKDICATTAEKLEGTSHGMEIDPLLFPPLSISHLPLLLHPGFTHSLLSGVVANIYLAERMASAEREPIMGVLGQSPQRGPGAEPLVGGQGCEAPWSWKGFTFWTCNENCKLAWQLSVFWKLSKPLLFVISLQNWGAIAAVESRCKATLFMRSKTFRVEQHQYEGWTDTAGSKETEFTISLCVVPYRATRCIGLRYSGLLDNLLVYQNVTCKLLILVQYTTS